MDADRAVDSKTAPWRIAWSASIELRLVLLICAAVLLTAGLLVSWGLQEYRAALLGQQLRELEVMSSAAEARITQLARSVEQQVVALAREDDFRHAVKAAARGGVAEQADTLRGELADLASVDAGFVELQLYDVSLQPLSGLVRDGGVLQAELVRHEFPSAPTALELARRLPEGHSQVIGPLVMQPSGGQRTLRLQAAAPVFNDDGVRVGVLFAQYDLGPVLIDIWQDASQQLADIGAEFVFIDLDGRALGDAMASHAMAHEADLRKLLATAPLRATSSMLDLAGESYGVAAASFRYSASDPGRYSFLVLTAARADLLARANDAMVGGILASVLLTFAAMVLALAFARGLLKPLDELLAAVMRFGEGRPIGKLPVRRRDEVGRLAQAFGQMAAQVDERSGALAAEILERQRTETKLRDKARHLEASEARYRRLYENTAVGVCVTSVDGWILSANPACVTLLGYPSEAALKRMHAIRDLWVGPEDRETLLRKVRQEGEVAAVEIRLRRRDGRLVWVLESTRAVWNEAGDVTAYESTMVDITERKQADYARRASEVRFRRLSDSNMIGVAFGDLASGEIGEANSYILRLLGYEASDLPMPLHSVLAEDWADVVDRVRKSGQMRQPLVPLEKTLRAADGSQVPVLVNIALVDPHRNDFVAAVIDRSAEAAQRRQLSELQEFFRFVLNSVPTRIAYIDAAQRIVFFNEPYLQWYGVTSAEVEGRLLSEVIGEDRYRRAEAEIRAALAGEHRRYEAIIERDGRQLHFDTLYVPHRDESGEVLGFFSVVHDVSEMRDLEARLRQSHKLEALGQLTGGIAHDFNNLLSVVIGNLQLFDRQLGPADRGSRPLQAALRAATRGAELTRRLLSFARRQPLRRCSLDLHRQLDEMREMIVHTLGEAVCVELDLPDALWAVDTDPAQLESALLNLAINARDAMQGAGTLTIAAENLPLDGTMINEGESLEPGDYVLLRVSDNGPGMSPDVVSRAFEPFFSTKPVGEGSGLGLAMVYGFARQSGGSARLRSQVGEGTHVELLLRRATAAAAGPAQAPDPLSAGGCETILVVEDDDDVRVTTMALLADLGYQVLDARDGVTALEVLADHPEVALLLTDVLMPGGLRGTELAVEALRRRPQLRVLYATGFEHVRNLLRQGALAGELLWKPLDPRELALRVRMALDGPPVRLPVAAQA